MLTPRKANAALDTLALHTTTNTKEKIEKNTMVTLLTFTNLGVKSGKQLIYPRFKFDIHG